MANKTIKIALLGAGYAGQSHAFGYRNAAMDPEVAGTKIILDTVIDGNEELARTVADKYGFENVATDYKKVLEERPDIDAFSIALPNRLYVKIVPEILAAGKAIFCEKPLGLDGKEAQTMVDAAQQAGTLNAVGFSFRRIPALAALHDLVKDGRLGDIHFFRAMYYADYAAAPKQPRTWRYVAEQSGGGALADIGAHTLDTVRYIIDDVTEVSSALLETVIKERPMPAGGIGHSQKASETEVGEVTNDDNALLNLKLKNGAIGNVTLSRITKGTPNDLAIEVYGTKGHAKFSSLAMDQLIVYEEGQNEDGFDGPRVISAGPAMPYFEYTAAMPGRGVGTGYGEAFMAEIQEFVRALVKGEQVSNPFSEAIPTMKVIAAALESAETGKPVAVK